MVRYNLKGSKYYFKNQVSNIIEKLEKLHNDQLEKTI
jgi:hypothetical protein